MMRPMRDFVENWKHSDFETFLGFGFCLVF